MAAALLAGGCSSRYSLAQEIACQQRMVLVPSAADISPQLHHGQGLPAAFETMSRRYAAMNLDGCTDDQRARISELVRLTQDIATRGARLPKVDMPDNAPVAVTPDVVQFVKALSEFETRRQNMQRDLDRMRAVRLR